MAYLSMISRRMCANVVALTTAALLGTATLGAQSSVPAQQQGNPNSGMNTGAGSSTNTGASNNMNGMPMAGTQSSGGGMSSGSMQDKTFAKKALAGGMAEVQLGQLAQQKSSSDDVKKFGQQMVDDHTKLNDQMKPIAASIGVQPPADVTAKDKQLMTRLQGLSGDDFDKAYIKAMLKDHKEDDKEFQMEASAGQNQQEKDAATQGDQIIKQHLQMVMDLAKAHSVPTGGKAM